MPKLEILGQHAERRVRLHVDLLDAAPIHEVVDVASPPRRRKVRVDVVQREAEGPGLFLIDGHLKLRSVVLPVGADIAQQRAALRQLDELIPRGDEALMPKPGLILQLEVKPGRTAEGTDGRGRGYQHAGADDGRKSAVGPVDDGRSAQFRGVALVPVAQADVALRRALPLAAPRAAKGQHHALHGVLFVFEKMPLHLFDHLEGFRFGGSRRQLHLHGQDALILVGQEGGWHPP